MRAGLLKRLVLAVVVLSGWAALPAVQAQTADGLVILPAEFTMNGPVRWQRLIVEEMAGGQFRGQVHEGLKLASSDEAVVKVVAGEAIPQGNGTATITAQVGDRTAQSRVTVAGMDAPSRWSFRNHVESILAKAGCSSGACHGAASGKNGFRLSLRGYDPDGDFNLITRQVRGRRVIPSDPGRSLLVTKPSGGVPHKGGVRFPVHSRDYNVLAQWIAAGTPAPSADDPRLQRLEILPAGAVLKPGLKQQLILLAHFTDGCVEDVTRWAKFTSANESVAQVDDLGNVQIMGYGEGAITAWYLSQVVAATVSSPYEKPVPPEVFANAQRRNFIDELVLEKLQSLNIPPSLMSRDDEFIRRAFIDTIGVLPTAEETRAFLTDTTSDKRDRLIESLLARPEFVDYWTYRWSDLLLVNSEKLPADAMWSYYSWIRNEVQANTPWNELVRKIVTAKGSTVENGATNFFVLHKDPPDMAETTTVAFLGMSINCAKCHNHPLEKWTNNQYFAFANLFARVRTKDGNTAGNKVIFSDTTGELIQPLTGKPQLPTPLDGVSIPLEATADRRDHLAAWLTAGDNPYFSRAITNRIWANFMGVGLVEMVDDMRLTNPASNDKLLNAVAGHLVEQKFDLKSLMRTILQSSTYQRSSQPTAENAADGRFYSHYYPRRMMAEVLLDAISSVSGSATQFGDYPAGYRALQLPDSAVASYFLKTFGRPDRLVTCECERTAEPSMVQVLHISNGSSLNDKLQASGNRLEQLLSGGAKDEQIVEEAYLSALSRFPTTDERAQLQQVLSETPAVERRAVIEDLYWSILSSKEFLFNH